MDEALELNVSKLNVWQTQLQKNYKQEKVSWTDREARTGGHTDP